MGGMSGRRRRTFEVGMMRGDAAGALCAKEDDSICAGLSLHMHECCTSSMDLPRTWEGV